MISATDLPLPLEIAERIELSTDDWPGNCWGVASRLREAFLPQAELCYGLWMGPISRRSIFRGRPLIHHAWLEQDGQVIDPTRWVFEGWGPYIYVGPNDHYDFGGNHLREVMLGPVPVPEGRQVQLNLDDDARRFIELLLGHGEPILISDMFWLANKNPDTLNPYASQLYQALEKDNMRALVPIDSWNRVMRRGKV